ncbi:MAG: hypothetical protein ACI84D_002617 [Thalassolituus oleivorans]
MRPCVFPKRGSGLRWAQIGQTHSLPMPRTTNFRTDPAAFLKSPRSHRKMYERKSVRFFASNRFSEVSPRNPCAVSSS